MKLVVALFALMLPFGSFAQDLAGDYVGLNKYVSGASACTLSTYGNYTHAISCDGRLSFTLAEPVTTDADVARVHSRVVQIMLKNQLELKAAYAHYLYFSQAMKH